MIIFCYSNRFEVAILSSPTDIRAVYSPPLSCPPSLPHPLGRQTKVCVCVCERHCRCIMSTVGMQSTVGSGLAAGVLLELHIDTDLTINVTPKEVHTHTHTHTHTSCKMFS